MQLIIHPSAQRQGNGESAEYTEPNFRVSGILVKVTSISVNQGGTVTVKLQHSADGEDWVDVPSATTTGLTTTGTSTITIDPRFACFDNLRLAWTFSNANSITFYGIALGDK